jgi:hypothetical protein
MMYIHRVIFDLWLHFCWWVVRSSIYQGHSVVLQRIVDLFYEIATLLFRFLTFHDCALKGVTKRRLALAKWANTDFLWAKKVVSFGSIHLFNKTISRLITSFFLLISVSPIIKRSLIALCLQIEIPGVYEFSASYFRLIRGLPCRCLGYFKSVLTSAVKVFHIKFLRECLNDMVVNMLLIFLLFCIKVLKRGCYLRQAEIIWY